MNNMKKIFAGLCLSVCLPFSGRAQLVQDFNRLPSPCCLPRVAAQLADELDVPLLAKVPISEALREHADSGTPLVTSEPDSPASQAIRQAARGIIAATPQELPVLQAVPGPASAPPLSGTPLPVVN